MLSSSAKFVDDFYACKSFRGKKILCLVDGEHYPPVTKWALQKLESKGNKIVAVVFLGGTEKVENAENELKDDKLEHEIYMGKSTLESALLLIEKAIILYEVNSLWGTRKLKGIWNKTADSDRRDKKEKNTTKTI